MITLQDILEIENTEEILQFTCPGTDYLLWPSVRTIVLRMVMDREIWGEGSLIKTNGLRTVSFFKVFKCFFDGLIHNIRFLHHQAKIVFFNTGITNIFLSGTYFNRVTDYFALSYPDSSLLIEDPHTWQHLRPRANRNVAYHIPFQLIAQIYARRPFNVVDHRPIREFVKFIDFRLKSNLKFVLNEQQISLLTLTLNRYCSGLETQLKIYEILYKRIRPDLIFFEDGCYGARGHMIRLAKEMGIKTAELQHGLISKGHDAYNFAPAILSSDIYRVYVPDYYLAYGQWWADQISIPSEVLVIGNPHYDKMRLIHFANIEKRIRFLLLSDVLRFTNYLEIARKLRSALSNSDCIMIRPHPMEKKAIIKEYGRDIDTIIIDDSDDLYGRLAETDTVIGAASTTLFEAVGLAEKVFVMRNPITSFTLPDCPFDQFETIDQLFAMLSDSNRGKIRTAVAESIWANNWEESYRNFIQKQIGLNLI